MDSRIDTIISLNNSKNSNRFGDTIWNLDLSNTNIITSANNYYITKKDGLDCLYISASTSATLAVNIKPEFLNFRGIENVKYVASVTVKTSGLNRQSEAIFKYWDLDDNSENWVSTKFSSGTYDWSTFEYIGNDICEICNPEYLKFNILGPGQVWISNFKIKIMDTIKDRTYSTSSYIQPYDQFKGVNISPIVSLKDFIDLKNTYNANIVRLTIENVTWSRWIQSETTNAGVPWLNNQVPDIGNIDTTNISAYYNWMETRFQRIDNILNYAKMNDIKVIIDMHKPIGMFTADIRPIALIDDIYCYHFYKIWEMIATRYKDHPAVFAYDLINEPFEYKNFNRGPSSRNYDSFQQECVKIIRNIDPNIKLIIEFNQYASAEQAKYLSAYGFDDNLIYSFHIYSPNTFVNTNNSTSAYPSGCYYNGEIVDKNLLRKLVQPVRDFQLKYQVPIYVGEFSCYRWNPGGNIYLKDFADIFDEYGWNWTYFSYRDSADSWDLEFNDLPVGQNNSTFSLSSTPRNDSIKQKLSACNTLYIQSEQTPIAPSISAEQYNDSRFDVKWNWPNCFARKFNVRLKENSDNNFNLLYSLDPLTASPINSATISAVELLKTYNINVELSSTYGSVSSTINYNMVPLYPTLSSTSGVDRAFSLRKIRNDYSGNCIRIRRSIDNTETDIGFNSFGYVNTSAISSFCTSGNGFVVTWYDQIGSSNISNVLTASQPIIMSAGNIITNIENNLPTVTFGVSNSFLSGAPSMYNNSGCSVYIVKKDFTTTASQAVIGEFNTTTLNTLYSFYRNATRNLGIVFRYDGGSSIFGDIFTNVTFLSATHQITITDSKTNVGGYINSGSKSPNQNYTITSAITPNIFTIGARVRTFNDQFYTGNIQEIIILNNSSTEIDRAYITRNQIRHYNC